MNQPNNPLHGITLEAIIIQLVDHLGWEEMGRRININCFKSNPSVKSSLAFLRKTPWAREKVEQLFLTVMREK
ncbi:MAG: VF530 family protein [Bacteroidota bacterium]